MAIYIVLILFIVLSMLSGGGSTCRESKRGENWLRAIFILIYLLCALRSSSVGRDVPGYEMVYNRTQSIDWENWNYVYFEVGYILLMKICISLGLSFQWFLAIVYAIIIYPIYLFIKKFSNNYGFSVLLFVCYQFFNFDLSGIRQAISMSIVLVGYILLLESKRIPLIKYAVCVVIATLFHKGAFIAFIFIPLYFVESMPIFYGGMFLACGSLFFVRTRLMSFIKDWFQKDSMDTAAGLYIGTNFMMILGLSILFAWYLYWLNEQKKRSDNCMMLEGVQNCCDISVLDNEIRITTINIKMFMIGFSFLILFGAGTAVRSYMVMNQVILLLLPNLAESEMIRPKGIFIGTLSLIFIIFFVMDVLLSGGFDIVPYMFFWQVT